MLLQYATRLYALQRRRRCAMLCDALQRSKARRSAAARATHSVALRRSAAALHPLRTGAGRWLDQGALVYLFRSVALHAP